MKAVILNSGQGTRMGKLTETAPKCMAQLDEHQTILSRQLTQLQKVGISEVLITTGPFEEQLKQHAQSAAPTLSFEFVPNPRYHETNYIYSLYLAREFLQGDILLLHGDLVFDRRVLEQILTCSNSHMSVSSTLPLPEKDFKAVIKAGKINAVGVEFFENAISAQALYRLTAADWAIWMQEIIVFIDRGETTCYAENALNCVSHHMNLFPLDTKDLLCAEADTPEDLAQLRNRIRQEKLL